MKGRDERRERTRRKWSKREGVRDGGRERK
jgi:hypothetical protein